MWMAIKFLAWLKPVDLLAQRYNICVCVYNKTVVYTKTRAIIREVNILFFYSRYAPDKVSTFSVGLHHNKQRELWCKNKNNNNLKKKAVVVKCLSAPFCFVWLVMSGLKICFFKKNLQHSLISSKSIFFATSPFHSLQMTLSARASLCRSWGSRCLTTWPGPGGRFGWKKFGFCAMLLGQLSSLLGRDKSWWEGGFHIFYRAVLINR